MSYLCAEEGCNIKTTKNEYWIEFVNRSVPNNNSNGYYVFIIYNNINKNNSQINEFVAHIARVMNSNNIRFIKLSLPYHDRIVVHTTSHDRKYRQELFDILLKEFNCKKDRAFWYSFEDDENAHKNPTWHTLLNDLYRSYNKKLKKYSEPVGRNIVMLQSKLYNLLYKEEIMNRDSMVVRPIFRPIRYDIKPKTAFVLMPFGEKWSDDSYYLIQRAGVMSDVEIKRADDFFEPNVIMEDIWQHINESAVIIADITVHNPNVFYELGIAHTLGKTVILIKQPNEDVSVPFDIQGNRFLEYGLNPTQADGFIERLAKLLSSLA